MSADRPPQRARGARLQERASVMVIAVNEESASNHPALRPPCGASSRKSLLGQEAGTELPVLGASTSKPQSLTQSPPPTNDDRRLLGDRDDARPKLRRESASLCDRARLTQRSKVRALRWDGSSTKLRSRPLHRCPIRAPLSDLALAKTPSSGHRIRCGLYTTRALCTSPRFDRELGAGD